MNKKIFWVSIAFIVVSFIILGNSFGLAYNYSMPSYELGDYYPMWLVASILKNFFFAFQSFIIGIVLLAYSLFKKD